MIPFKMKKFHKQTMTATPENSGQEYSAKGEKKIRLKFQKKSIFDYVLSIQHLLTFVNLVRATKF